MILVAVAFLIAVVLALLTGVIYIDFLKKNLFNQYIREEAPKSHEKKAGTPTTGGVFLIVSAIVASVAALFMAQKTTNMAIVVLLAFIFYAFTGFKDDYSKIAQHQNEGLTPRAKLLLQLAIAVLPAIYMTLNGHTFLTYGDWHINLGWLYPVFAVLFIAGMSNAVNLTDGLDGLAATNFAIVMIASVIINLTMGKVDLAIISAAVCGACLGFLYFNKHPAKVFMGDTGSLALGGFLGTIAVIGKFEVWAIVISFIFISETLSVMLQVASYKLTKKRIFKMTPIHHHFELLGWKETTVVKVFSLVSFLVAISASYLFWVLNK